MPSRGYQNQHHDEDAPIRKRKVFKVLDVKPRGGDPLAQLPKFTHNGTTHACVDRQSFFDGETRQQFVIGVALGVPGAVRERFREEYVTWTAN